MKVLYVADNRNRGNYGCRATSTALSQLVASENEIVGRITGRYTHLDISKLFFFPGIGEKVYGTLGGIKHWSEIKTGLNLFFNMIKPHGKIYFSAFDFMSMDLDKSISNLLKCIPANPELKEFDIRQYEFDAMVVNGEGSFIFSTPPWRESIVITMLMYWAQKMGKKVFFCNAMFSDSPISEHNEKTLKIVYEVLKKCEIVQVREQYSFEYVKKYMPELTPILKPDALFSWYSLVNDGYNINNGRYFIDQRLECDEAYYRLDFTKPYICISASSVAGVYSEKKTIIDRFVYLVNKIKEIFKEYNVFIVETCEGDRFILDVAKFTDTPTVGMNTPLVAVAKILANAKAYVTGRYHPSIMASLGGTPCVFMTSNSHKTISIQEVLGYEEPLEYPFMFSELECKQMLERVEKMILQGEFLRQKIKTRAEVLSKQAEEIKTLIV